MWEAIIMKEYEYKFLKAEIKWGFDYGKSLVEIQGEWNKLGKQGWRFCAFEDGIVVFMRELEECDK